MLMFLLKIVFCFVVASTLIIVVKADAPAIVIVPVFIAVWLYFSRK